MNGNESKHFQMQLVHLIYHFPLYKLAFYIWSDCCFLSFALTCDKIIITYGKV